MDLDRFNELNLDKDYDNKSNYDLSVETFPELLFPDDEDLNHINSFDSILDKSLIELVSMDIEELRSLFMNEIKSLKNEPVETRKKNMQHIFDRLFKLQPSLNSPSKMYNGYNEDFFTEHRLYSDLISTPGLSQIDYVVDFLKNDFCGSQEFLDKKFLLLAIFEYYSNHSKEACDKFNYIYRSSDEIGIELFDKCLSLDSYFSEDLMNSFRKEELSQLFRFYFSTVNSEVIRQLCLPENRKNLFIFSQLNKKVNSITTHTAGFIGKSLFLLYKHGFKNLFDDIYDKIVGGIENEKVFDLNYTKLDNLDVMQELINCIFSYNDYFENIDDIVNITKLDDFLNLINNYYNENYDVIFGSNVIQKVKSDNFDLKKDFSKINNKDLDVFKNSFLKNIYGINLEDARGFQIIYGKYIKELEESILEEDIPILEMFKSIMNIVDLDQPNLNEKVTLLRLEYLKRLEETDFNLKKYNSYPIVESLLNRIYMNTYNKVLTKASNNVISYDDGVPLLDAGVEFNILLTSLSGVNNFFDRRVNMASRWNTAALSQEQGLCTSFINNQNLGVITFKSPFLGFVDIPRDVLNSMGDKDIFTATNIYNLRNHVGDNYSFIPANKLSDETRYGYNELVLDRFLINDEKNILKLQPSYVVFYKFNEDDYKNTELYKNSLKTAKDFGIPIMVIDVPKVKQHEKEVIAIKEQELFASVEPKPELLREIVIRYMNNYTGSLTMVGEQVCSEDFSVKGMRNFFESLEMFILDLKDKKNQVEWLSNLEDVYLEEKEKYSEVEATDAWNYSVRNFVLEHQYFVDDLIRDNRERLALNEIYSIDDDGESIFEIKDKYNPEVVLENGDTAVFLTEKTFLPHAKTIVDLLQYLDMCTIFKVDEYEFSDINRSFSDVKGKILSADNKGDGVSFLLENLVCSYFLGNGKDFMLVEDFIYDDFNLEIDVNIEDNYDWNKDLLSSGFKNIISKNKFMYYDPDVAEKFILKIEAMSEEKFLEIFEPIIENQSKKSGESKDEVSNIFLNRKNNIRSTFENLNNQINSMNNEKIITKNDILKK